MHLKLYVSSRERAPYIARHVEEISVLIERLSNEGIDFQIIDTNEISYGERKQAYRIAAHLAIEKKFAVASLFEGGLKFGKSVPAYIVYRKDDNLPIDVYPKEAGFAGPIILIKSIKHFLVFVSKLKNIHKRGTFTANEVAKIIVNEILDERRK